MGHVKLVDEAMVERTKKWIYSKQNADGSWDTSSGWTNGMEGHACCRTVSFDDSEAVTDAQTVPNRNWFCFVTGRGQLQVFPLSDFSCQRDGLDLVSLQNPFPKKFYVLRSRLLP